MPAIINLIKSFFSLVLAVALALGLFIGLGWIIESPQQQAQLTTQRLALNWANVSKDAEVETMKPPPPPSPPEVPPQTPSPVVNNPSAPATNLAPPIDLAAPSTNFNLGNSLVGSLQGLGIDASTEMPVHRQVPEYPRQAYSRRIEGWVELEFEVDAQGKVIPASIQVVNAQPKNIFNRSAIQAIARWRFAAFELQPGITRRLKQRLEYNLSGS